MRRKSYTFTFYYRNPLKNNNVVKTTSLRKKANPKQKQTAKKVVISISSPQCHRKTRKQIFESKKK